MAPDMEWQRQTNSLQMAIITAIRGLRKRKYRPDKTRIIEYVLKQSRMTVTQQEIETELTLALQQHHVMRVKFRDGISYRVVGDVVCNEGKFSQRSVPLKEIHANVKAEGTAPMDAQMIVRKSDQSFLYERHPPHDLSDPSGKFLKNRPNKVDLTLIAL